MRWQEVNQFGDIHGVPQLHGSDFKGLSQDQRLLEPRGLSKVKLDPCPWIRESSCFLPRANYWGWKNVNGQDINPQEVNNLTGGSQW